MQIIVGPSSYKKNHFISFYESPLKMVKYALFLLSNFVCTFWSYRKTSYIERYDNFKIYDVATGLTKNSNTHFAQYLTI